MPCNIGAMKLPFEEQIKSKLPAVNFTSVCIILQKGRGHNLLMQKLIKKGEKQKERAKNICLHPSICPANQLSIISIENA